LIQQLVGYDVLMLSGCRFESTPKHSARKRHYPRCSRRYKEMGQAGHMDIAYRGRCDV